MLFTLYILHFNKTGFLKGFIAGFVRKTNNKSHQSQNNSGTFVNLPFILLAFMKPIICKMLIEMLDFNKYFVMTLTCYVQMNSFITYLYHN